MEHELWTVYEAQKIDTQIREHQKKRVTAPAKMEAIDREIGELKDRVLREKEIVEELEKERRRKEKEFEAEKEKVKKYESRLYEVKTNKEYQALLKEIEGVKQANDKLEEDILIIMEKVEDLKKDLVSSAASLAEKEKEAGKEKERLQKEMGSMDEIITRLTRERNSLLKGVSSDLQATYNMLLDKRGGIAVVTVKNDTCLGCSMNIPPQLYIEVTKNERLILCPSCNRILYFVADEAT